MLSVNTIECVLLLFQIISCEWFTDLSLSHVIKISSKVQGSTLRVTEIAMITSLDFLAVTAKSRVLMSATYLHSGDTL